MLYVNKRLNAEISFINKVPEFNGVNKLEISPELIKELTNADRVAVLTGAGVSQESGISTFRDKDGLWSKFSPMELASVEGFMANPERVWDWYNYRKEIVNQSKPNKGHFALAAMEKMFNNFSLITQNVDQLHQKAGSTNVIELHGNIMENHCNICGESYNKDINLKNHEIPKCELCGGMVRPSVVWFGEMLPEKAVIYAEDMAEQCNVFLCIGTSAEVYPAANLPIIAKRAGACVVEINPNDTVLSRYCDYKLPYTSAAILPELIKNLALNTI